MTFARPAATILRATAILASMIPLANCRSDEPAARIAAHPPFVSLSNEHCATIELEWAILRDLDRVSGRPLVFLHLLDRPRHVVRTFDHGLPWTWSAGPSRRYPIDLCLSELAGPVTPGDYILSLGVYDSDIGYRWPLDVSGKEIAPREFTVATVRVSEAPSSPAFIYRGEWSDVEDLGDHQWVRRRKITGEGRILIPKAYAPWVRMVFIATQGARGVLRTSCSGESHPLAAGETVVIVSACDGAEIRIDTREPFHLGSIAWITSRPTGPGLAR